MPLNNIQLSKCLEVLNVALNEDLMRAHYNQINRLSIDSRTVDSKTLFIGLNSSQFKATHFVQDAHKKGAPIALVETLIETEHGQISETQLGIDITVYNLSSKLFELGNAFYFTDNNISNINSLNVTAITGTNGKTSIATIVAQLSSLCGQHALSIGTLGACFWKQGIAVLQSPTINTTPDIISILEEIKKSSLKGAQLTTVEASSHGLEQKRLGNLPIKCAIFTNLSQDHLDYHRDMSTYAKAKRKLLAQPSVEYILLNADDPESDNWENDAPTSAEIYWYDTSPLNTNRKGYWASDIKYTTSGISFILNCNCDAVSQPKSLLNNHITSLNVEVALLGSFNVLNLIASIAALHRQNYALDKLCKFATQLTGVVGRMELYPSTKASMLVDYAHTPDALKQALIAARSHTAGKLICVFGCGGDRDKSKRAIMGQVADTYSDEIVLTQDNPRTENPSKITENILQGIKRLKQKSKVKIEQNRKKAIFEAWQNSNKEDLIVIAGKGHETYIEVNNERVFYDERAFVSSLVSGYKNLNKYYTADKPTHMQKDVP